jgi:3-phenylpropionate/cinnamic acid dioxygenase small subunit
VEAADVGMTTGQAAPAEEAAGAPASSPLRREEAEAFLYRECRLLDTLQLEEWLELFTEDGLYWLPIVDGEPEDAGGGISIVFDDV